MENLKSISVYDLVKQIRVYAQGDKRQSRPMIVWFDNVEPELRKYSIYGDPSGLAYSLSNADKRIVCYQPFTNPVRNDDYVSDGHGGVRKLSEEEKNCWVGPESVKPDETKVYIHAPYEGVLTTIGIPEILYGLKYGIRVHELHIPTFVFYPYKLRTHIKDYIVGYNESLCSTSIEEEKSRWFDWACKRSRQGFQHVDNFYLDFLKSAPEEFISYKFDPRGKDGVTFCDYAKWVYASCRLPAVIRDIIGNIENEEHYTQLVSIFRGGNLNLGELELVLDSLSNEKWSAWFGKHIASYTLYQGLSIDSNRVDVIKMYLCSDLSVVGNIPEEAIEALVKFHNK